MGGKGNRKEQRKRRKQRAKLKIKPLPFEFELIDGNFSRYAIGYCKAHGGHLTAGLIQTHDCIRRECKQFVQVAPFEIDKLEHF